MDCLSADSERRVSDKERITELEREHIDSQAQLMVERRELLAKLAAAQATISRMRKLARPGQQVDIHAAVDILAEIYNHPADRTALDAMLAEAEKRGMLKAAWICEPHEDDDQLDRQCKRECADAIRQAAERSE